MNETNGGRSENKLLIAALLSSTNHIYLAAQVAGCWSQDEVIYAAERPDRRNSSSSTSGAEEYDEADLLW